MKIYKVGGCVRDHLMGVDPKDVDWLVVGATPEQMEAQGYARVGGDFPVFLHPQTKDEYALARKERKTSAGHKGFHTVFDQTVTMAEDLSRRDLTINAMAMDPATGEVFDPHGGKADLASKTLRHVSEAFSEDPLRVLRLARFRARTGFRVAPETLALCVDLCAQGSLRELSAERVCAELRKLFCCPDPAAGMESLLEMGALASLDASWPGRLAGPRLGALAAARADQAPEWALARLACAQGLDAPKTQSLFESLRFPGDVSKQASRAALFCSWAKSPDAADPALAALAMERSGSHKLGQSERDGFWACVRSELAAEGVEPEALERARQALWAANAIAGADLSQALLAPKAEMPQAVRDAKRDAFAARWAPQAAPRPAAKPRS